MNFTAKQIAEILQGEIQGDETVEVNRLAKIEEGEKGTLTFLANPKYNAYLYTTNASIAIINKDFELEKEVSCTLIRVEDAYQSFSKLLEYYNQVKLHKVGVEQPSFIDETAKLGIEHYVGAFAYIGKNVKIGDNVKVYPHCYIGDNVVIGDNTTLFTGVKVYSETVIGNHCNLHADVIVGCDGFGFAPNDKGEFTAVPQTGNVIIEDNVDIGSATTIDRATLGSTIIRRGVKLDNQIQVAHNVEIGKNTVIAAQTGIAGSTKIGESCMIGGQVGFAGHLTIGNGVKIQAQSGIGRNLKDGAVVQGSPAFNYTDWNKSYVHFKNLGKLEQRVSNIEKNNKE